MSSLLDDGPRPDTRAVVVAAEHPPAEPRSRAGIGVRGRRDEVVEEVLERTLWLTPRGVDVGVTESVVTLAGRLERKSDTRSPSR